MKIRYVMACQNAGVDKQNGLLNLKGIIDNLNVPIFPIKIDKFVMLVAADELVENQKLKASIFSVEGKKNFNAEFILNSNGEENTSYGFIFVERMPIESEGIISIEILDLEDNIIYADKLISASYPKQRSFTEEEINNILKTPELIKSVKLAYNHPENKKKYQFELNLDKTQKVSKGFLPFPDDDIFRVEGEKIDLKGLRRQAEWFFGRKDENYGAVV